MESNGKRNREIICGVVALLIAGVFFAGCLNISAVSEKISSWGNINIIVYGMTLILFCLVFIVGLCIAEKKKTTEKSLLEQKRVKMGAAALLLVGQALFLL